MPAITPLGWFHTALGILALLSAFRTLVIYKEITLQSLSGKVYLLATLVTAVTALMIFQHGGFGPAHGLAVMTLLALAFGMLAATTRVFGRLSRYAQALGFSSTLLFHCVPAVTDALMRLPVGDPFLTSIEDPILKGCFLALFGLFLLGISLQFRWIYQQARNPE
jgi:uncharacterized membrane protein